MTTKFLDTKICTFKMLLSWRFPRKQASLDDFPLCPQAPPPQKPTLYIFIVVSPSLIKGRLPKGSFDKCVCNDLPVPMLVPTPPTLPTPFPFSLIPTGKPPPNHPPETRPQTAPPGTRVGTRTPLRKLPPLKNYPLVSARKFPELPWKFPRYSLTVELNSNPEVPRKFPRLPRNFRFPGLPGSPQTSSEVSPSLCEAWHPLLTHWLIEARAV